LGTHFHRNTAVVLLEANVDISRERILARNHPEEREITSQFLETLQAAYWNWYLELGGRSARLLQMT
jgi:deoxyadenosine/deoxycytidine kinase